jgi:hypothetical protein
MGALGGARLERATSRLDGMSLSTAGRTLRERCASVRWLLAAELARLAFVAISLAAAFLTLSWQTLPVSSIPCVPHVRPCGADQRAVR